MLRIHLIALNNAGNVVRLGATEFFEDLTYNVAYGEVMNKLRNVVDIDNKYIDEALKSALTVMATSALFYYIQRQEQFIEWIFKRVSVIAGGLLLTSVGGIKSYAKKYIPAGRKGRKFSRALDFITGDRENKINTARAVTEFGSYYQNGAGITNSATDKMQVRNSMHQNQIAQEAQHLNYARSKVASQNETLLFKLFTKNLTNDDKEFINRITGNKGGNLDIDTLNKVANFMYVTDDSGNISGLTEEFMNMLNGLGYLHNKVRG